jgi:hypothetical protein
MAVPAAPLADTVDAKVLLSVLAQIKEGDLLQIELERDPDNPHQPGRPRKETNGK